MNLSSPLSSLIPSLDAVALEVLAGTESALGASRIHQLGRRGSRQGITNALDRLVEHGLVTAEPTNHGAMYRLNREHLLTPSVLLAADARRELFRRLAAACGSFSPAPVSVSLFGSVARSDSTPDSDIDLLIVVSGDPTDVDRWSEGLFDLTVQVDAWTGNHLAAITQTLCHLTDLVRAGEPIIDSWQEDAVTIFGSDIRSVFNQVRGQASDRRP
jgi:predicted nucleotidyltransferase